MEMLLERERTASFLSLVVVGSEEEEEKMEVDEVSLLEAGRESMTTSRKPFTFWWLSQIYIKKNMYSKCLVCFEMFYLYKGCQ